MIIRYGKTINLIIKVIFIQKNPTEHFDLKILKV